MRMFTSICHVLCGAWWTQATTGLLELLLLVRRTQTEDVQLNKCCQGACRGPCPGWPVIPLTRTVLTLGAKVSCPRKWLVKKEDPQEKSVLSRRDGRRMRRGFQVADPALVKGEGLPEQASSRNRRKPCLTRMSQPFWNNPSTLICHI